MTGSSSTAVLPTLVAVAASLFVARKLERHSIDETELARRGVHLKEGREMAVLERVTAGQAMRAGFEGVPASATAPQLQALVSKSRSNAFVVVDAEERMVGILSLQDLRILDQATAADLGSLTIASDLAERNVVSVFPTSRCPPRASRMDRHGYRQLPWSNTATRATIGMPSAATMLITYRRACWSRADASIRGRATFDRRQYLTRSEAGNAVARSIADRDTRRTTRNAERATWNQ